MSTTLTRQDKDEIFSHQAENGLFSAAATAAACLNYMDRLNRKRLDTSLSWEQRTAARRRLVELENRLYRYIQDETPLSYFDADFREKTAQYIALRTLFLKAEDFTFTRHRLSFLTDLLRLYREDPCSILPERDIACAKWERILLQEYFLFDMTMKNTETVGREAVSNGYHECDYTLEIEEGWKQPIKAVLRANFRYVLQCLPYSKAAAAVAAYVRKHGKAMRGTGWTVEVNEIEETMEGDIPCISPQDGAGILQLYYTKN